MNLNWLLPLWGFSGEIKPKDEANNANEHNMVKYPNRQEEDHSAIYQRARGAEVGSTEKQPQLSQSGPVPALGHAASIIKAHAWKMFSNQLSVRFFPGPKILRKPQGNIKTESYAVIGAMCKITWRLLI